MATATYKVLGQAAPTGTGETTLYTVPGLAQAVVSTISICNITTSTIKYAVNVRPAAAAVSNRTALARNAQLLPGESDILTIGISLATTDVISVNTDTANGAAFQAFGTEIA